MLEKRGVSGKRRGENEVQQVARVVTIVLYHYLAASTLAHTHLTHTHAHAHALTPLPRLGVHKVT